MSLRKKTLLIVGLTTTTLVVMLYFGMWAIARRNAIELEGRTVRQNVERVWGALQAALSHLDLLAGDWAEWDDTCLFVQDANEAYIKSNLMDTTLANLRLNLIAFLDRNGRLVYCKAFDLKEKAEAPVSQDLQTHLSPSCPLVRLATPESRVSGILLLADGPILVASRPILSSEAKGPVRGAVVFGRRLDADEIQSLQKTTRVSVSLRRCDDPQLPPDFLPARESLTGGSAPLVRMLGRRTVAGYMALDDLYGKPALLLRVDMPRDIYEQGMAGVRTGVVSLLGLGVVFGFVVLILLERLVVSPLGRLAERVGEIGATKDLSARLPLTGPDELCGLAGDINRMLGQLERSTGALRESEEKYRTLVENSLQGIVMVRRSGIVFANSAAADIVGYTIEELTSLSVEGAYGLVHPDDRAMISEHMEKRLAGAPLPARYEFRLLHKDGSVRWVEIRSNTVEYEGESTALVACLDVTERKRAEEALRASEANYRAIFDAANDAIFVPETDTGRILDVNRKITDLFGYTPDEVRNMDVGSMSAGEPGFTQADALRKIRAAGTEGPQIFEWLVKHKNGQLIWAEVSLSSAVIGGKRCVLAVVRDISERKQLAEQVRRAQRMESIGTLASGVAHNFNNILSIILGNAELAKMAVGASHKAAGYLDKVMAGTERAAALAQQLLSVPKRTPGERARLNPSVLVSDVARSMRMMLDSNIRITCVAPDEMPRISANQVEMEQVLINLCLNARDAMPRGGTITLKAEARDLSPAFCLTHEGLKPGPYACITVADTGIGMDEATLSRIFDPFFTTKEPGQGIGLGLATAYGTISSHSGYIDVQSKVGEGTTFSIFLPIADGGQLSDNGKIASPRTGAETILVVDDESEVLAVASRGLGLLGYKVLTAGSGREAVETCRREAGRLDLIVLDYMMPEMDGQDVYLEIRKLVPNAKVLVASGYDKGGKVQPLLDAGADGFIHKPYRVAELSEQVRAVLDAR